MKKLNISGRRTYLRIDLGLNYHSSFVPPVLGANVSCDYTICEIEIGTLCANEMVLYFK